MLLVNKNKGEEGIEADLASGVLRKTRPAQDGIYYWDLAFQEVVLGSLGNYLPRVKEKIIKKIGLFSKFRKGREMCSKSTPLDERGVAKDEVQGLIAGIDKLEANLKDPHIDPNAKVILQNFKLPDPEKLPNFYRIAEGRLLIIWGCETSSIDLIPAREAVAKLPIDPGWKIFFRRLLPYLKRYLLPFLLILLGLILLFWILNKGCSEDTGPLGPDGPPPPPEGPGKPPQPPGGPGKPPQPPEGPGKPPQPPEGPGKPPQPPEGPGEPPQPPEGPDGSPPGPSQQHQIWLPVIIDDEKYHATTLGGISDDMKTVYLAEPDDNSQHQFPPKSEFTSSKASIEQDYPALRTRISNREYLSYIIGVMYPSYAKPPQTSTGNQRLYLAAKMPDLSQNAQPHWKNLCAPTSGANLIWFMSQSTYLVPHPEINPMNTFKDEHFVNSPPINTKAEKHAADYLVYGLKNYAKFPKSLATRMQTTEKGTSVENIAKGMLSYLNEYESKHTWTPSAKDLTTEDTLPLLKDILKTNRAALLFLKLETPPEGNEPLIEIQLKADSKTNNGKEEEGLTQEEQSDEAPIDSQDDQASKSKLVIELVQGSESYSNGQITGKLLARDVLKPNSKLTGISWHIAQGGKWDRVKGDGQIIDFMRPKGVYLIGLEATNSKGLKVSTTAIVQLNAKETQKVTPSIIVKPGHSKNENSRY